MVVLSDEFTDRTSVGYVTISNIVYSTYSCGALSSLTWRPVNEFILWRTKNALCRSRRTRAFSLSKLPYRLRGTKSAKGRQRQPPLKIEAMKRARSLSSRAAPLRVRARTVSTPAPPPALRQKPSFLTIADLDPAGPELPLRGSGSLKAKPSGLNGNTVGTTRNGT